MYREWGTALDGAVVWTRTQVTPGPAGAAAGVGGVAAAVAGAAAGAMAAGELRVLPDGCLDLIWRDGELLVAGPDTTAQVGPADRAFFVAIRFAPGQGPTVLGVPASELTDRRVPLDALWPAARVRDLAGELGDAADHTGATRVRLSGPGDAPSPGEVPGDVPDQVRALVAAARRWLADAEPDPVVRAAAGHLARGHRVDDTAGAVNLSPRQLHRLSLAAFGYGPKTLARVLRFNRALALARTGASLARVAAETGYADQAHLAREVRGLAGVPLRTLLPRPTAADRPPSPQPAAASGA